MVRAITEALSRSPNDALQCSPARGSLGGERYAELFAALADVLNEFPDVAKAWPFVFVPSASDVGLGDVLPRAPIPASVTQRLVSKVPNAIFTSNPCRCVHVRARLAMHMGPVF